jgi:hypothetical protein
MNIDITKTLENVSNIKLGAGVVGKVSTVLVVYCVTLGALAALSSEPLVRAGAITAIVIVVFPMLWRLINFADKNPQAAILEGAEFLVHEQMMVAQKGSPERLVDPRELVEVRQLQLTEAERKALNKPETGTSAEVPNQSNGMEGG